MLEGSWTTSPAHRLHTYRAAPSLCRCGGGCLDIARACAGALACMHACSGSLQADSPHAGTWIGHAHCMQCDMQGKMQDLRPHALSHSMCGRCGPICLQYDMSHAAILAHSRMPHAANLAHPFLVDCSLQTMFLAQAQDNYIDAALTTTLQVGGIAC